MGQRLNKFLSAAGVCSRREADRLIASGKVMLNNQMATLGMNVSEDDIVTVNGKRINSKEKVVLAFYKPIGVTCTEKDRHAAKIIKDILHYPVRLTYAGRLDKDSEGLLLMTNDGLLIENMMRGSNEHEKEYFVKVDKEITDNAIEKLTNGVRLPELNIQTKPCKIHTIGKYSFHIILTQGVNKQIRRMCATCGYQVKSIKRMRVMNIQLANLKPGEYRSVKEEELKALYAGCGIKMDLS